jgi:transcriptional regulator with XRE-family HTH domain
MPRTPKTSPGLPGSVWPRLRALVEADGRGVVRVAEAAGFSQSYLSQLLTGRKPNPRVESVGRVLAALGRSWGDLDG